MHTGLGHFQCRNSGVRHFTSLDRLPFHHAKCCQLSAFPGDGHTPVPTSPFPEPRASGRPLRDQTRAQKQLRGPSRAGWAGKGRVRRSPSPQLAPWAGLCKRFVPEQQPPHLRRSRPCPRPAPAPERQEAAAAAQ